MYVVKVTLNVSPVWRETDGEGTFLEIRQEFVLASRCC